MELTGKRIAIMLEDMYEDPEYWYPYYRFQEAGAEVVAVAPEKKSIPANTVIPLLPTLPLKKPGLPGSTP